ncbi:CoA transferase [Saccharothrix yanglingensis]|uniref:CoA transferase n=1 Tax=Saccharothrix yanglingensis TaxID=659496 RepID=UPI0027D267EC|nr:CoA transferase [Saccharothrix yanglingensis]
MPDDRDAPTPPGARWSRRAARPPTAAPCHRSTSPRLPEEPDAHADTGTGRRSTPPASTTRDRRACDDLLDRADVVVTGYRPGALDRHGLAPDALPARRPDLVVARSARGHEGGGGGVPGALPAQAPDHDPVAPRPAAARRTTRAPPVHHAGAPAGWERGPTRWGPAAPTWRWGDSPESAVDVVPATARNGVLITCRLLPRGERTNPYWKCYD